MAVGLVHALEGLVAAHPDVLRPVGRFTISQLAFGALPVAVLVGVLVHVNVPE